MTGTETDSRSEQEPSDAPPAGPYAGAYARSMCARVHGAVWLLWAAVLTVLVVTGVWGLGWVGYLGTLFGTGLGLLLLSALAAGTAKKVAQTFPAFARIASLTDVAPSARDEAKSIHVLAQRLDLPSVAARRRSSARCHPGNPGTYETIAF